METLYSLLNSLNIKENNYEIITTNNDLIEYFNFIIKDEKIIKDKIDIFIKNAPKSSDIYNKSKECNLSLDETINTLNYLLSRKEIIDSLNKLSHFKDIIEILFSRIIVIYLNKCNSTNNFILKNSYNAKLCEYAIFYSNIFMNNIFKDSFNHFYKSLTYRSYNIATNYGCVISWMTFIKLMPNLINDECFLKINKNTEIYKKINWQYIENIVIFKNEFELFKKYILS